MRGRVLALCLTAVLLLGGCARLLNREYVDVTPHNAVPTAEGDPSTLRAESYQELVNALQYLVTDGAETGTVRLYMQSGQVEQNLEKACLEVTQEDPLGAYAVEYIRYSVAPLVTYQEVNVEITYRRTREQVASITSATGATAIRSELEKALEESASEIAIRISYFDRDEAYIRRLCREAYCANPGNAVDMPELEVYIYPDSGRQRIVEVRLTYHLEQKQMELRRELLAQEAGDLVEEEHLQEAEGDGQLLAVARAILERGGYQPGNGSTAYHALLRRGADSQGLALAMALLCDRLERECLVAIGERNGEPHYWNVVRTESGWMHMDLTRTVEEGQEAVYFLSDAQMSAEGCSWNGDTLPRCGMPAEEGTGSPEPAAGQETLENGQDSAPGME